jgi:hypothetical protein
MSCISPLAAVVSAQARIDDVTQAVAIVKTATPGTTRSSLSYVIKGGPP